MKLDKITFRIDGNPIPKPRMTKSDTWRKRPCVLKYRAFATRVLRSYLNECMRQSSNGRYIFDFPVSLSISFNIVGSLNRMDLSNCVKSIEDALNRYAWEDDTMQYIREYDNISAYSVCEIMNCHKKRCKISDCTHAFTYVTISRYT